MNSTSKLNGQEQRLLSMIRNAKDPQKALIVAIEAMVQFLEKKEATA